MANKEDYIFKCQMLINDAENSATETYNSMDHSFMKTSGSIFVFDFLFFSR